MANFDSTTRTKINSGVEAGIVIQHIQNTYRDAKQAQALLNRYTANTDLTFNTTVNAMFTSSERAELNQVLTQINTLCLDLETNHAALLVV
jgi:hypothetical protein